MLKDPNIEIVPIQMRLVKYQIKNNTYCLGTTLIDQNQYTRMATQNPPLVATSKSPT